ncbi:MAG: T9SS type A sorting domain-containing protein [Bacteroidales bacterium]
MKSSITIFFLAFSVFRMQAQVTFINLYPDDSITEVQPMTGIVFWHNSGNNTSDAITLEFSYMLFNEVVSDSGVYNWDPVEEKLNAIAGRNHQAIFRFRYVYPGYETSVPEYILNREDYHETIGESEGKTTHFPDWTNEELKRFTLEFYTRFAERYDQDPRLAFIQVGFGLWAEYHIYSGPFTLGVTFPSKEFQESFFYHLDTTFKYIPWSISIDAADDTYTPFVEKPHLKEIEFGLFDDSFMHQSHSGYNTSNWNFFDRDRYLISPAGGEFSYYSAYDQQHVLDLPDGSYGKSYEQYARDFHISYIMGNDQPRYQTMERIKQASMASGYKFKIEHLKTTADSSVLEILNYGVAPIYYDAYITIDGTRSQGSLKGLAPGETKTYSVSAGAEGAEITIECDKLPAGMQIQFYGTQELPLISSKNIARDLNRLLYPNPARRGSSVRFTGSGAQNNIEYSVYDLNGRELFTGKSTGDVAIIDTSGLYSGCYLVKFIDNNEITLNQLLVL